MDREIKVHDVTRVKNGKAERYRQRYHHKPQDIQFTELASGLENLENFLSPELELSIAKKLCLQWGLNSYEGAPPQEAIDAAIDDLAYELWKAETAGEISDIQESPVIEQGKAISLKEWDSILATHLQEEDDSWRNITVSIEKSRNKTQQISLRRDMSNRRFGLPAFRSENLTSEQTKMLVCKRLSDKLKDTDIHLLFEPNGSPCINTTTGAIFMLYESDNKEDMELHERNEFITKLSFGDKKISPQDPNYNDYLREAVVSELVAAWANDSQKNYLSAEIQRQVAEMTGGDTPKTLSDVQRFHHPEHKNLIKKFIEASYEETQKMLHNSRIEHLIVHRGFDFDPDDPNDTFANIARASTTTVETQNVPWGKFAGHDIVDVPSNPVSSYSIKKEVAKTFSKGPKKGWAVVTTSIPVERVLATPATGIGCKDEYEVVVIGDRNPDRSMVSWSISRRSKVAKKINKTDLSRTARERYKRRAKHLIQAHI